MLEVRHRTYTKAEQRFLDYIDSQLKGEKISNFSLKCIDYGDAKYKFDFPICRTDSLRESLWNELDVLEVENPASPRDADGVPQRGKDIKRKRGGNAKTPFRALGSLIQTNYPVSSWRQKQTVRGTSPMLRIVSNSGIRAS